MGFLRIVSSRASCILAACQSETPVSLSSSSLKTCSLLPHLLAPLARSEAYPAPRSLELGGHWAAGAWGPWAAIWHTLHCDSSAMTNGWRGGDIGWCHRVLCRACPSSGTWSRSWVSWLPGGSSSPCEGWLALAQCQGFWFCINHAHA